MKSRKWSSLWDAPKLSLVIDEDILETTMRNVKIFGPCDGKSCLITTHVIANNRGKFVNFYTGKRLIDGYMANHKKAMYVHSTMSKNLQNLFDVRGKLYASGQVTLNEAIRPLLKYIGTKVELHARSKPKPVDPKVAAERRVADKGRRRSGVSRPSRFSENICWLRNSELNSVSQSV